MTGMTTPPRRPVATPDTAISPDMASADTIPAVVDTGTATHQPATPAHAAGNMTAVTPDAVAAPGECPVAASGHRPGRPGGRWWLGLAWSVAAWLLAAVALCWGVDTPTVVVELARAEHAVSRTLPGALPASTPTVALRARPNLGPHPGAGSGVIRAGLGGLLAQEDDYGGAPDLQTVITNFVKFLLGLARAATIAALALGGLMMAFSGGSTAWYSRGKLAVQAGLAGFALAYMAPAIVNALDGVLRGGGG